MNNQRTTSLLQNRPRCYAKSPIASTLVATSSAANNVSLYCVALANLVCLPRDTNLTEVPDLGIHLANHTPKHNKESNESDVFCEANITQLWLIALVANGKLETQL